MASHEMADAMAFVPSRQHARLNRKQSIPANNCRLDDFDYGALIFWIRHDQDSEFYHVVRGKLLISLDSCAAKILLEVRSASAVGSLDRFGHRERFTRSGDAEQHLIAPAHGDALHKFANRSRCVIGRGIPR